MKIDQALSLEIWHRLVLRKGFDGLALASRDGRVDLRGLVLPDPSVVRRYQTSFAKVVHVVPREVRLAQLDNLDFSGSKINGLRLFGCELKNCCFDDCQLEDWRMWSTTVFQTSFRRADLRKSALGATELGRRNTFSGVDFTKSDLRQTTYLAAAFDNCTFSNTNLENVDFQTSTFSGCQFSGELRRVLFHNRGFKGEPFPANEMVNVDFSRARLRSVEFRGLRLDTVRLPNDADHVIVRNYVAALDRVLEGLRGRGDLASRQLVAYLEIERKWVAPDQVQGVLNMQDLIEVGGLEGAKRVRELLLAKS